MPSDDNKALYSKASKYYVENHNDTAISFDKSKAREEKHNKTWEKQKVNLNTTI